MTVVDIVLKNQQNPAYVGAQIGIERVAARLGVQARFHTPDVPDSIPQQEQILRRLHDEGSEALAVVPAHANRLDAVLRKIEQAGTPLVTFVCRTTPHRGRTTVISDDHRLAAALADLLCTHLEGRGRVAVIDGNPDSATYQGRYDGFREVLATYPGIELVAARPGHYLEGLGYEAMKAMLAQHGQFDGVLAANDVMAIGALEAMRQNGGLVPTVSVNAIPDAIEKVKDREILATASFNAMWMACLALEAAVRILDGETVPDEIVLPVDMVTAETVADWDRPYAERPLPVWGDVVRAGAQRP